MKLSVVLSTQFAKFQAATFKGDLVSSVTKIADLGYEGVELAIRDPNTVNLDELEYLLRKHDLSVPAIGTGQAWGEEGLSFTDPEKIVRHKAIERIKSHIPLASRFKAVIIIGLIRGVVKPEVEQEQAEQWLADALLECSLSAHAENVRLALEPINRYETTLINTALQGKELVEKIGMPNFGLLLDTFHMNIEEAQIEPSIRMCGDRIFHFHVADSNRMYPGAGHLDFRSILAELKAAGYDGWISGEFLAKPDAITAAGQSIKQIKMCLP